MHESQQRTERTTVTFQLTRRTRVRLMGAFEEGTRGQAGARRERGRLALHTWPGLWHLPGVPVFSLGISTTMKHGRLRKQPVRHRFFGGAAQRVKLTETAVARRGLAARFGRPVDSSMGLCGMIKPLVQHRSRQEGGSGGDDVGRARLQRRDGTEARTEESLSARISPRRGQEGPGMGAWYWCAVSTVRGVEEEVLGRRRRVV